MRRIECRTCGSVKRERLDFLADNPRYTKRFGYHVGRRCRQASISDVAKELRLDWDTVKTLEKQYMQVQLARAGTPGPRAIDAHLVAVGDGELEAEDDDAGEVLSLERVPRRPTNAHPLLGRENMAGVVVTIKGEQLTKALSRGEMASLRIRSLVDTTEPDASGASSLLVRLGASRGTPLTLGRIVALSAPQQPMLTRAAANLCGQEADAHPLAVNKVPKVQGEAAIAPVLAVRHVSDDLCLRIWSNPLPATK